MKNVVFVSIFIEPVEKMGTFYKSTRLDISKSGVSFPGFVLKCLIKALMVSIVYLMKRTNYKGR